MIASRRPGGTCRREAWRALAGVVLAGLLWLPLAAAAQCLVVRVGDGGTLTARCGVPGRYQAVKVRLAGIGVPQKAQPLGRQSRQSLSDLCHRQEARLTPRDWDRDGRTVASVQCRRVDAAKHQVRTGMAWVDDRSARGSEGLYILQDEARRQQLGLWAEPLKPSARMRAASR